MSNTHRRPQAVRRARYSKTTSHSAAVPVYGSRLGWPLLLIGIGLFAVALAVASHLQGAATEAEAAERNAVEILSQRPDGLSEKCMKKLIRSYFAETTAERYERQQLETALKSGAACQ